MSLREIPRKPLRSDVHAEIRSKLLRSEFEPFERLKDAALAAALGTSRTPVREALIRLEREGFLENTVGRGFRVRPLTATEASEVYPIVWTLESLALRTSNRHEPRTLDELRDLIDAMERAGTDAATRIALDNRWHALVCGGTPNRYLLRLLEDLKTVTYRYEFAFMRLDDHARLSAREHREVWKHLKKQEIEKAATALERHWQSGMRSILKALEEAEEKNREKAGAEPGSATPSDRRPLRGRGRRGSH
jgi:DNA-binding GntR family transcriptional regulator